MLQMVVFFFLFGAACAAIGDRAKPVVQFASSVAEVMFRYTKYVMYLAPFGVGAAIAVTVGQNGLGVLRNLGKLVGTLYLAASAVRGSGVGVGLNDCSRSLAAIHTSRSSAVHSGLLNGLERSGATVGSREHGALRRPQAYRRLRACRPATASTWMGQRFIWRSRRSSSLKPPMLICP